MADNQTQTLTPPMRFLKLVVEMALTCALVYFAVRAVIGFLAPESLWTSAQQTESLGNMAVAQRSGLNFNFSIDPFHRDAVPTGPASVGQDAPETTLSLKLFGRRAGPQGSAIIETPDRVQGVFKIDDEIIDGVTLKAVNPDFIVLSRNGVLERLMFERESEGLLGLQDGQIQSPPSVKDSRPNLTQISSADLMSTLTFKTVRAPGKSGQIKGFEIGTRSDAIKLETFGLRKGDIVTAIGGQDLTQGRPDMSALITQLSASNSVQLNVLRGSTNLVIDLGRP